MRRSVQIVVWYLARTMKNYLFVMRHLPHVSSRVQEALDQLLTVAAFDQQVSVLFLDDGVYQLKAQQSPQDMGLKNTAATYSACSLYGVTDLYVETESLQSRGLSVAGLILPVLLLPRMDVCALLNRHTVIITD
jgi:tRNA 2-thiouridine synthesizing protein C